jgi:hypothetical protein
MIKHKILAREYHKVSENAPEPSYRGILVLWDTTTFAFKQRVLKQWRYTKQDAINDVLYLISIRDLRSLI